VVLPCLAEGLLLLLLDDLIADPDELGVDVDHRPELLIREANGEVLRLLDVDTTDHGVGRWR
jgi:hypothetical protein